MEIFGQIMKWICFGFLSIFGIGLIAFLVYVFQIGPIQDIQNPKSKSLMAGWTIFYYILLVGSLFVSGNIRLYICIFVMSIGLVMFVRNVCQRFSAVCRGCAETIPKYGDLMRISASNCVCGVLFAVLPWAFTTEEGFDMAASCLLATGMVLTIIMAVCSVLVSIWANIKKHIKRGVINQHEL